MTYELSVYPPEAATGIKIYQDTPDNYVAKVPIVLRSKREKVYIKFRSLVLVGPFILRRRPGPGRNPDQWPEECQPWLKSTWCVDSQHEKIQAVSKEIRYAADDVMSIIAGSRSGPVKSWRTLKAITRVSQPSRPLTSLGSCTSNANLVAALLRGCNIPARVVAGYPSWTGPLQTHYIVEAWMPQFGWYPIEATMLKSPWPNEYQVNVAVVPPKYESEELANWRPLNAAGVPYLSLTEIPDGLSGIIVKGAIDPAQNATTSAGWSASFRPATANGTMFLTLPRHDGGNGSLPNRGRSKKVN